MAVFTHFPKLKELKLTKSFEKSGYLIEFCNIALSQMASLQVLDLTFCTDHSFRQIRDINEVRHLIDQVLPRCLPSMQKLVVRGKEYWNNGDSWMKEL